ncbi:MFS transporter [Pectinatus haikarae]
MLKKNNMLVYILAVGVFGILNTEMGFVGVLPFIASQFDVSIMEAGTLVSLFALGVAIAGPTMPLLFSGINRKLVMLMVLGIFILGNIVSIFAPNFTILLIARVIPAFFHPIYCSLAFSVAAASVKPELAPKAVTKIVIGVSAGMVIGVPISNFIAGAFSLKMALSFFAFINVFVFLVTLIFVPSMPVKQRLSYGSQISVLKKPMLLISILAVILMNGAVFGVFNYLAEYLGHVTAVSLSTTSVMLFVYGAMNIFGSMLAGELLTRNALHTVRFFIIALFGMYSLLFLGGQFLIPMIILTILWGLLGGINANATQYWISHAAPEAPDLANGVFLTSANLGTTLGTAVGGVFIAEWGTPYVVLVGLSFIALAGLVIFAQINCLTEKNSLNLKKVLELESSPGIILKKKKKNTVL